MTKRMSRSSGVPRATGPSSSPATAAERRGVHIRSVWRGVLVIGATVLLALRRWPVGGFAGAWFFLILAPTSVMPGKFQIVVEHRMYLPLTAVMALAAIGIHAAVRRRSWIVFAALALGLGALATRRNEDYQTDTTLWRDTVAKRPDNERARYNPGVILAQTPGRLADAVAHYEAALRLKPDSAETHDNLGLALAQTPGRLKGAVGEHRAALRLRPDYAPGWHNLGAALYHLGDLPAAAAAFREEVRLSPDDPTAREALTTVLEHDREH